MYTLHWKGVYRLLEVEGKSFGVGVILTHPNINAVRLTLDEMSCFGIFVLMFEWVLF